MAEFEDALEALRAEGPTEPVLERLWKFSGTALRRKAEERDALERRALAAEAEVKRLEVGPLASKLKIVLAERFVDVDKMRRGDWESVLEALPSDTTEENLAEVVADDNFMSALFSELQLPALPRGRK